MLIVLPPSEAKQGPDVGAALDLTSLSLPLLTRARERVLDALVAVCSGNTSRARHRLGLTINQDAEIQRNARLLSEPTAPALDVFTGVLYAHLAADDLSKTQRRWLDTHVTMASGLFGFVRPTDNIPPYRLGADVALPKLGSVASYWRKYAAKAMTEAVGESLILDCRSQQYVPFWTPSATQAENYVTTRVLQRKVVKGEVTLKVVSHHNKATKGLLVRALAQSRVDASSAQELHAAVRDTGFEAHLEPLKTGAWQLDVVTD